LKLFATLIVSAMAAASQTAAVRELEAKLDEDLPARMQRLHIPGAAAALVDRGAIVWSKGYGLADRITRTPFTPSTIIRAASISKALCAWAVMRLVEQGAIDLDAPAARYLKRWKLPPSGFDPSQVTIRRALSHTAGLAIPGRLGFNRTLSEVLDGFPGSGGVRLIRPPGERFQYTNAGFNLLQAVIEDVTAEPYHLYMERVLLEPLGMRDSTFDPNTVDRRRLGSGHMVTGERYQDVPFAELASGGLYSTVEDLARFLSASMPGSNGEPAGRGVITPASVQLMMRSEPETGGAYGLGYETRSFSDGSLMAAHNGRLSGWSTRFAIIPKKATGFVIVANGDAGFALLDHATCPWLDCSAGLQPVRPCRIWQGLSAGVLILSFALTFLLVRSFAGRRRYRWSSGRRLWNWIRAAMVLLIGVVWIIVWHTGFIASSRVWMRGFKPAMVMPESFTILTVIVVTWCLVIAAVNLRTRNP